MPMTVTQTGDRDEPFDWWMRAMGVLEGEKPKKNYLVGFPDARASDLIPTLATHYRDQQRGAAGSSSSGPRQEPALPDPVYFSVVRNVLSEVRANESRYARKLSDEEMLAFAKSALEASDPSTSPSRRIQWTNLIATEMVNIVSSIIEDVLQKSEARVAQLQEVINYNSFFLFSPL